MKKSIDMNAATLSDVFAANLAADLLRARALKAWETRRRTVTRLRARALEAWATRRRNAMARRAA